MTTYTYSQMVEGEEGWLFYEAAYKCWKEIFKRIKGNSVLDVGCGGGISLALMKVFNPGLEVYGIDGEHNPIWAARRLIVKKGAANMLQFPDKGIDTVYTSHVLEHLDDVYSAIKECARVANRRMIHVVPDGDVEGKNFGTPHKHVFNRINFKELFSDYNAAEYLSITDNHMNSLMVVIDR